MRVFLPDKVGFCFGVKRAISRVEEKLKEGKEKIYCLGDLIHNPEVMENLVRKGLKVISDLSEVKGGVVFTRAHGTPHSVLEEAAKRKIKIVETTCPYVIRLQKIARRLAEMSYPLVIVGSREHPEIDSLIANIKANIYVVSCPEEVKKLPSLKKIAVLSQTTESLDNFKNIVNNLLKGRLEVRVFNTLCRVVRERQEETRELAEKVEAMVVVGGRNSSNTRKLVKICQEKGVKTFFVEKKEDLNYQEIKKLKSVGVTGGTSTPEETVKEVAKSIIELT